MKRSVTVSDLLVHNIGVLVSGDWRNPLLPHDTVVVKNGKIEAVGGAELKDRYPSLPAIDAMGVTVAPGLIDSHCHPCAADYTFRQKTADFLDSEVHGGVTTMISAGEPHFPGRPTDAAGAKAQAIFLSKCFCAWSPLGAKVHGGAVILERGLTEDDFAEMAREGVWLVGEIGLGSIKAPEEAAPLVAAAKRHNFKIHMHTGGTSLPGSAPVSAADVIAVGPTVASHCNGGPTSITPQEAKRIIDESDIAVEIVQCGNFRMAGIILDHVRQRGQEGRVIFGNDAPSGTGVIPLGILRNVCYAASVCGVPPALAIAMASGNTAATFSLNTGIIAPGREADLICLDAPVGSAGATALEAIALGDLPAVSFVIIDGAVATPKSRNTPPGNRTPLWH